MPVRYSFEYKIVAMLVLVLVLVLVTGLFAYQRFTGIVNTMGLPDRADARLVTVQTMENQLSTAELSVKSFSLTGDTVHMTRFFEAARQVNDQLAELRSMDTTRATTAVNLDSLENLIEEKFWLLNDLLLLQDKYRVQEALGKVTERVTRAALDNAENGSGSTAEATTNNKRKGFWRWLRGNRKEREAALEQAANEALKLEEVAREVTNVAAEEETIEAKLKLQEIGLLRAHQLVTDDIRSLLNGLKEAELLHMDKAAEKAAQAVRKANTQIAWFCVVTGLLLLFVAYLIVSYVRKARLARTALRKANAEAQELSRTRERFVANMSHEIRTPLTAIAGFTEQLAAGPLNANQQEHVEIIQKSAAHLLNVVNEVLDFSKLQAGKMELSANTFSPMQLLTDTAALVRPQASEKQLQFELELDAALPDWVRGDDFRLRQILLNLLGNALKFTHEGSIALRATPVLKGNSKIRLRIEVADTGIGMNPSQAEKVFGEFTQAGHQDAAKYGGTGLGLSITQKLVELQEGTIRLQSKVGYGTTVSFEIPYDLATEPTISSAPTTVSSIDLTGLRVLVADDEPYNRKLIETMLAKFGARLTLAENGAQAVNELSATRYDLLLLDARMPIMDGLAALTEIRSMEDSENTRIPTLVLTAAISDSDREAYSNAGANAMLAKPFTEAELLGEIARLLPTKTREVAALASAMHTSEGKINFDELREMCTEDADFYLDMLQTFQLSATSGLAELHQASNENNWSHFADVAHRMCAPCHHLSVSELYPLLKEAETLGRQQPNEEIMKGLLAKIEEETSAVLAIVEQEIADQQA